MSTRTGCDVSTGGTGGAALDGGGAAQALFPESSRCIEGIGCLVVSFPSSAGCHGFVLGSEMERLSSCCVGAVSSLC